MSDTAVMGMAPQQGRQKVPGMRVGVVCAVKSDCTIMLFGIDLMVAPQQGPLTKVPCHLQASAPASCMNHALSAALSYEPQGLANLLVVSPEGLLTLVRLSSCFSQSLQGLAQSAEVQLRITGMHLLTPASAALLPMRLALWPSMPCCHTTPS